MAHAPGAPPLLQARGVDKIFPGVRALDGVDFTLRPGEIHALLGENGAGKSTLIKVITGVLRRDGGALFLNGQEVDPHAPAESERLGIAAVHQEAPAPVNLSVAENIFFGRQPTRFGLVRRGEMNRRAAELLKPFGLDIDVSRPLSVYSLAVRQLTAIARAVDLGAKVLILDEPTASLDKAEVQALFRVMRRLAKQGVGIIFITHFLDQVFEVGDRLTVLRNGAMVGERAIAGLERRELVELLLGRAFDDAPRISPPPDPQAPVIARARGMGLKGVVEPFDLEFRAGQVVGAAGLLGSGRTETALLMFGALMADTGALEIDGEAVRMSAPRQALARRFAMLPESRKADGIVGALSVRENIILALQARQGWLRPIPRARQNEIADRFIRLLDIRTPDAERPIEQLSGGNQQKALIARWLATEPVLFLLDEPTQGVDIGAHAEILKLVDEMRANGMAVYLISSEIEELTALSQTVSVMRDRRQVRVLPHDQIDPDRILGAIADADAA
ncbi:MAG: sugar ABC transporter ATP-binding protein [Brevundimonas sp.]|uniref:sugar ABC transporter ATP-binding protein n=1 Tax=Brevundimonas sp. TaxID=1871086 RepID=UPI00391A5DA2